MVGCGATRVNKWRAMKSSSNLFKHRFPRELCPEGPWGGRHVYEVPSVWKKRGGKGCVGVRPPAIQDLAGVAAVAFVLMRM